MTLVTAGSFVWPIPLTDNQRDWRVLQALSEDWREIHIFVRARGTTHLTWAQGGITCEYLPTLRPTVVGRLRFVLSIVAATIRLHRRTGVDLFVASDPLTAVAGWLVRRLSGVPVLFHLQGELVKPPAAYGSRSRRQVIGAVTRWACRRVDAVRVVHGGQVAGVTALGVPPDRVFIVGSRCDTTQYDRPRWEERGAAVRRSVAGDATFVAVFVGTLLSGKGLQVAIDAWADVLGAVPDAVLVVVGDGPFRADLVELAERKQVSHAVRFVGAVAYDEVPSYLAAADVFLFPSFSEGSPRAIIEAMSMSLPVVATRVGGIPDLLADGEAGVLVHAGDASGLAGSLTALAADPTRRRALGAAAREAAVRRFDFGQVMQAMRTLYRQVARRGRRAPARAGGEA